MGCYGADWVTTSNIDRLAAEGVLFESCTVNNPVCTPSRASMWTGKHLPGHGVYKLHDILPDDEVLFSRRLRDAGYRTALFGKLHVSGRLHEEAHRHPNDGFDVYEWCLESCISMDSPFNGYTRWLREQDRDFHDRLVREGRKLLHVPRKYHLTHWAAERTIDYLRSYDGGSPFFCMMSVFDPHNPYEDYPEEMLDLVDRNRIPEPVFDEAVDTRRPFAVRREQDHSYLGSRERFTAEDYRRMRLGYYASIALIDVEVGRVLETLEEQGLAENTIVIYLSDHGDLLGDHGLVVKGATLYDPCVKVPLVIRWPGHMEGGRRERGLVQPHDLAATLLAAAGYTPEQLAALMPEALDLRNGTHEQAVCCYRNTGINDEGVYWDPPLHVTMLRDRRHKLIFYHGDPAAGRPAEGELFDMTNDPLEMSNLWEDPEHATVRARLTGRLVDWLQGQELLRGARGGEALPAASQRLVNALK